MGTDAASAIWVTHRSDARSGPSLAAPLAWIADVLAYESKCSFVTISRSLLSVGWFSRSPAQATSADLERSGPTHSSTRLRRSCKSNISSSSLLR